MEMKENVILSRLLFGGKEKRRAIQTELHINKARMMFLYGEQVSLKCRPTNINTFRGVYYLSPHKLLHIIYVYV